MSSHSVPGPLFRPYQRLIKITVLGKELEIPENNMLLRGFQFYDAALTRPARGPRQLQLRQLQL